jgi:hypothetical protein
MSKHELQITLEVPAKVTVHDLRQLIDKMLESLVTDESTVWRIIGGRIGDDGRYALEMRTLIDVSPNDPAMKRWWKR